MISLVLPETKGKEGCQGLKLSKSCSPLQRKVLLEIHLLACLFGPGLGNAGEGEEVSASNEHCGLVNRLPLHISDNIAIFMVYGTPHGRAGHVAGSHTHKCVVLAVVPCPEDFRWKVVGTGRRARKMHKANSSGRRNLRRRLAWTQRA